MNGAKVPGCSTVPAGSAPCRTDPGTDGHPQGAVRPFPRAAPCRQGGFRGCGDSHSEIGSASQGATPLGTLRCPRCGRQLPTLASLARLAAVLGDAAAEARTALERRKLVLPDLVPAAVGDAAERLPVLSQALKCHARECSPLANGPSDKPPEVQE